MLQNGLDPLGSFFLFSFLSSLFQCERHPMIKVHNNASTHRASGAASSGSESDVILLPFSRFYPEHRGESLLYYNVIFVMGFQVLWALIRISLHIRFNTCAIITSGFLSYQLYQFLKSIPLFSRSFLFQKRILFKSRL